MLYRISRKKKKTSDVMGILKKTRIKTKMSGSKKILIAKKKKKKRQSESL